MKKKILILSVFLSATFGLVQAQQTKRNSTGKVYKVAEQRPQFAGGEAALKSYFQNALASHKAASNGVDVLNMVIDKTGQPKNIEVGSGMDAETNAMVLDAASKMPKWQPGKQKGHPVSVRMTVPVSIIKTA